MTISLTANVKDNIPGVPGTLSFEIAKLEGSDAFKPLVTPLVAALGSPEVDLKLVASAGGLQLTVTGKDDLAPDIAKLLPQETIQEPLGGFAAAIVGLLLPNGISATAVLEVTVS